MSNVRNWYIYIISAISLQAVTWSTINLLRNLLIFGSETAATAFQIAVIVIGLPVFLVHWLWAQRLAQKNIQERGGILRTLYLYATLAGFLGPFIPNTFDLFRSLIGVTGKIQNYRITYLSVEQAAIFHGVAMLVLAGLWYYHERVLAEDTREVPMSGHRAVVRRLYVLGFSAAGLAMTTHSVVRLIRWVMQQLGGGVIQGPSPSVLLAEEITRLAIGLVLWLVFWRWAQRLYYSSSEDEHNSALRYFYLYGAIFVGALNAVINLAGILESLFRRLIGVTSTSHGSISQPLPIIIGMIILWGYHAYVLHHEVKQAGETSRQAGVRRLYYYLVAAVGLAALLIGLSGDISVLIRSLDRGFGTGLKQDFSMFTAAIIAGLPVWLIPWLKVNAASLSPDEQGKQERRSIVRKIYLYFFLFVAVMTLLGSAVFILFRLINMVLSGDAVTLTELGQTIAYSLIAVGVLLYHGSLLRGDQQRAKHEEASQLEQAGVVVLDIANGTFGNAVIKELKSEMPELNLEPILLAPKADDPVETDEEEEKTIKKLTDAALIVGPWTIAVHGGFVSNKIVDAVVSSPARKLLAPLHVEGWDWAGVERSDEDTIARHTARAVTQALAGEQVKLHRPMGVGAIIAIVIGVLILLAGVGSALFSFLLY